MKISKITLGTAQLGSNYGIANKSGKPNLIESMKILNFSMKNGITSFDTSPVYGNSEEIIGNFISSRLEDKEKIPIISSKLRKIGKKSQRFFNNIYNLIKRQIQTSLRNLNIKTIPIYLIHHVPDLLLEDGLVIDCLNKLKEEGFVDKIGVSIYNSQHIEISLKFKEISVIQVPISIFDLRLINSGLLKKLKEHNYFIFARSIFLQGLLFKSPNSLPKYLSMAEDPLLTLQNLSNEYNIDIAKIALLFIRDLPEIDSIIIGAEKVQQVQDNLKIFKELSFNQNLRQQIIEEFSDIPEKIINPSLWNR